MAQQQAAAQVARLLSRVGRWGVILGVGGSVLQTSLYTGAMSTTSCLLHFMHCLLRHCIGCLMLSARTRPLHRSSSL